MSIVLVPENSSETQPINYEGEKNCECFTTTRELPRFGETVITSHQRRPCEIRLSVPIGQKQTIPVKTNHWRIVSSEHRWESEHTIMCKSPTNNSLASSDSSMWSKEEKTKSCSILCQEFVSVFLPKTELIPAGYPRVGCLPLLTRRYSAQMPANMTSTSCLWLYAGILPPKEKTEAQNGVSTSAILGPLRNAITSLAFWLFFFLKLFHQYKEKAAVVPSTVKETRKNKMQFQRTLDSLKLEPSCKVREKSMVVHRVKTDKQTVVILWQRC